VDKTGAAIDVQAAALDWLITDARQAPPYEETAQQQMLSSLFQTE
jgi:mannose-1-phosphate guanylyltransferase